MADISRGSTGGARCVVYVAAGDERFRDEAKWSLASLRRFMPDLPAILLTDAVPASPGGFDEIVHVDNSFAKFRVGARPWREPGWLTRIDAIVSMIETGAYERVLFLDADVEITGDISGVFEALDRFDVAAAHAPLRNNEFAADIPDAFPELNLGLVALRKSPSVLEMLRAWRALYLAQPDWWYHDQATFRRAVWSADVRLATLPPEFNVRPARFGGRAVPRVLHGFARSDVSQEPGRRIRFLTTDLGQDQPTLGWEFAMRALAPLTHPNGVLFDPMVDNTFGWHLPRYRPCLPHGEPWVGVVHNPPDMPAGAAAAARPEAYCESDAFRRSLPNCLGLFALSEQQAAWFRRLGVPVEVVPYPVDLRLPGFSEAGYRRTEPRSLLQVGAWLQRPESFAELICPGHKKIVVGAPGGGGHGPTETSPPDVEVVPIKSRYHYDALLQRSVVFADVAGAAAHPVLFDCIARGTPLVVNRHPAIVEHVGADYPLFYESLEQAAALIASEESLLAGHRFLADPALRNRYSARTFVETMLASRIYRGLPAVG